MSVNNEFKKRLELAGGFRKRLHEYMKSRGIAAFLGEGEQEELEQLEKDMRVAGAEIPPPGAEIEDMERNLPDFAAHLKRSELHVRLRTTLEAMGTIEVVLLSPLTIRELAAVPAGTGLAFRLPQGIGDGEVLENLM